MCQRPRVVVTVLTLLAFVLMLLGPSASALAQSSVEDAGDRATAGQPVLDRPSADALSYLRSQQTSDGSFGGSVANTLEVTLALAAADEDISSWRTDGGRSVSDYIVAQAGQYAVDAASTGKLLAAVVAAGLDPHDVGGLDLEQQLCGYDDGQGAFSTTTLGQAWAMLGLSAAGQATGLAQAKGQRPFAGSPIPAGAALALVALQQADGGWEGGPGWGTDSNTTALALQALVGAGVPAGDPALARARAYLQAQLAPAGGFVYSAQFGDAADANSTAYGVQGVLALGEDPAGDAWTRSGRSLWDALLAFQIEGGAFEWQSGKGANLLATAQAVPALARVTHPVRTAQAAPVAVTMQEGEALSDTLVGRRAGAQALYLLPYPGDGREATVEVSTPAAHPLVLAAFGFNVYNQSGERVGGGSVTATSPEHVLRFAGASDAPGEWTVQVYNYAEGTPLSYRIVATGLGAKEEVTAPTVVAEQPPQPEEVPSLDGVVTGTLAGDRAGAHARFRLPIATDGEDVTVRLRFSPDDPATSAGLGFTVYAPSGVAVPGEPTGVPGERVAHLAAASAGDYLVLVHNYVPSTSMSYTLSH